MMSFPQRQDRRTWRFRVNPASPDGFDKRIFDEPEDVPDGEGWAHNRDAARALAGGESVSAAPDAVAAGQPFEALSLADQVAFLESQAAEAGSADDADADAPVFEEQAGPFVKPSAAAPAPQPGKPPRHPKPNH